MESKRLNKILPRAGGIRGFREQSDEIFGVCRVALLEGLAALGPFSVDVI